MLNSSKFWKILPSNLQWKRRFLIFSVVGRIERWRAHHAVYHSSECKTEVREWRDKRARRAPLQWPPVTLLCSRTEPPTISRHEIADWNCKDSDGKHRMLMVQCRSGEISAPAAPHSNDLLSHGYVRAQSRQQFHVMKSLIETAKIRMENIACWC